MIIREEIRNDKRVTIVERVTPKDLEKEDILARLDALEKHAAKTGYQPPAPPKGFVRPTSQE